MYEEWNLMKKMQAHKGFFFKYVKNQHISNCIPLIFTAEFARTGTRADLWMAPSARGSVCT